MPTTVKGVSLQLCLDATCGGGDVLGSNAKVVRTPKLENRNR